MFEDILTETWEPTNLKAHSTERPQERAHLRLQTCDRGQGKNKIWCFDVFKSLLSRKKFCASGLAKGKKKKMGSGGGGYPDARVDFHFPFRARPYAQPTLFSFFFSIYLQDTTITTKNCDNIFSVSCSFSANFSGCIRPLEHQVCAMPATTVSKWFQKTIKTRQQDDTCLVIFEFFS